MPVSIVPRLRVAALRWACVALAVSACLTGAPQVLGAQTNTAPGRRDGSFERGGVRLFYRTQGEGTPIVFLSGGPGLAIDYLLALGEFVPESYRRVFLEQRGTGRSVVATPNRETVNLQAAVDDLEGLRRHLGLERLLLLGHSYGGMLAMAYAAAHPDRVDRLILLSSGGATARFWPYFGANVQTRLRPEEKEAQRYWDDAMKRGVPRQKGVNEVGRVSAPVYFFEREKGLALVQSGPAEPVDVRTMDLIQEDLSPPYDLRPGLARLDRPVLVVHGHQDPVGDLTAEEIRASIKGATVRYINECGHFPWLEQPDTLRAIFRDFLDVSLPK